MLKASIFESGYAGAVKPRPYIAIAIFEERVQRGLRALGVVVYRHLSVAKSRQHSAAEADEQASVACLQQRVHCAIRQSLLAIPHPYLSVWEKLVEPVAVAPNPHTAIPGLQDVANVISGQALRLSEHCKLCVAQLDRSGIEQPHPQIPFAILKQRACG